MRERQKDEVPSAGSLVTTKAGVGLSYGQERRTRSVSPTGVAERKVPDENLVIKLLLQFIDCPSHLRF